MSKSSQHKQARRRRLIDEEVIRARCTFEVKERVSEITAANNMSEADFLREAVAQYIAHLESGGQRYYFNPYAPKMKNLPGN